MPLTVVVKILLGVNVVIYLLTMNWDLRLILALFPPGSELFRPFQLLSHFFMHGSVMHLLFNMFGLYMFGRVLEHIWGSKRFLLYYFACALGAMLCQLVAWSLQLTDPNPILGASGAVYGVLIGFAVLFPNHPLVLIFPPIPIKAKYFILILIGIDLSLGVSGAASGIAHFAHLGGAFAGLVLSLLWRNKALHSLS